MTVSVVRGSDAVVVVLLSLGRSGRRSGSLSLSIVMLHMALSMLLLLMVGLLLVHPGGIVPKLVLVGENVLLRGQHRGGSVRGLQET